MAIHNTASDAANTAVRAYLTSLGEKYLGHGFNTGSGKGKQIWEEIKTDFNNSCAYCNDSDSKLTMEHLISFNRDQGGLHHPGNIVPCCRVCNRRRKEDGKEIHWSLHLEEIVNRQGEGIEVLAYRRKKIKEHIIKYKYPQFSDSEKAAIQTIAQSVYSEVSAGVKRGVELYWSIDEALIAKSR